MTVIKKLINTQFNKIARLKQNISEKISMSKQCINEVVNIRDYKNKPLDFVKDSLIIDIILAKLYLKKDKAVAVELFNHLEIVCESYNNGKISEAQIDEYCKVDIVEYINKIDKDKIINFKDYPNVTKFIEVHKDAV